MFEFLKKIPFVGKVRKSSGEFYITTTLPYVNADPHIGFAMEIVRADVIARYKKLAGSEVFFNTGADEHGQKIFDNAVKSGKSPKEYIEEHTAKFKELIGALKISNDINFIRTTDTHHVVAAQEFWRRCAAKGDIYKKVYEIKYCVGCELEKTESELVNGKCPLHPNNEIEIINEENYFFRFSKYEKPLLDYFKKHKKFVIPESRFGEIRKFVERGLQDFSISRLKSKMPWGIEVPGDSDHVMYVWFDALVNYVSAVGWPDDENRYIKWLSNTGGMVQYCGKDNLRQQAAMWQAMLMSAGLPNSKKIIINGFITGKGGVKMSKSIGNVVSPFDVINDYGADALRYFLVREISSFEDSEFTPEKFKEAYNANLANGLGNLSSRILKMLETYLDDPVTLPKEYLPETYRNYLENFEIQKAADYIWTEISSLDRYIQKTEPFKLAKIDRKAAQSIFQELGTKLYSIGQMLAPILPETSEKIKFAIESKKMFDRPLFMRKD